MRYSSLTVSVWLAAALMIATVLPADAQFYSQHNLVAERGHGQIIKRLKPVTGLQTGPLGRRTGRDFADEVALVHIEREPDVLATLQATADLQAGPTGTAFASIAWPGSLAGNLGTTIKQLNQLCAPPNLMLPCLPVTDQDKQLLGGANDPVRAYATSSGKNDASYGGGGGLYMRAHADGSGTLATADAGVTSVAGDPVLTLGSVTSHAGSVVTSSTITGEATSSITGITVGTNLPIASVLMCRWPSAALCSTRNRAQFDSVSPPWCGVTFR